MIIYFKAINHTVNTVCYVYVYKHAYTYVCICIANQSL